jgi:hypothetical protein
LLKKIFFQKNWYDCFQKKTFIALLFCARSTTVTTPFVLINDRQKNSPVQVLGD